MYFLKNKRVWQWYFERGMIASHTGGKWELEVEPPCVDTPPTSGIPSHPSPLVPCKLTHIFFRCILHNNVKVKVIIYIHHSHITVLTPSYQRTYRCKASESPCWSLELEGEGLCLHISETCTCSHKHTPKDNEHTLISTPMCGSKCCPYYTLCELWSSSSLPNLKCVLWPWGDDREDAQPAKEREYFVEVSPHL